MSKQQEQKLNIGILRQRQSATLPMKLILTERRLKDFCDAYQDVYIEKNNQLGHDIIKHILQNIYRDDCVTEDVHAPHIISCAAYESKEDEDRYLKYGCNNFKDEPYTSMPLGYWSKQDMLQYTLDNQLPLHNKIIKTGTGQLRLVM